MTIKKKRIDEKNKSQKYLKELEKDIIIRGVNILLRLPDHLRLIIIANVVAESIRLKDIPARMN